MIIFRYLSRELTTSLCAITGVLLLIFLSNQFVRYLSEAATGKFAGGMLFRLILIEMPHLLGILLPLGLFLAILLVYGRLYIDNEMTVLSACGLSRARLTLLTLPVTVVVMIIVTVLSLWITPKLLAYRDRMLAQTGTAAQLETTLPGRFQETDAGQRIFYVENISPDRQHMQNLFMAQQGKDKNSPIPVWIITVAQKGYQAINKQTGDRFFVAENGRRYDGIPGENKFEILRFSQYWVKIESHLGDIAAEEEALPTYSLLTTTKNKALAFSELQWRLSMPLSALLLTLLAIPLSHVKPRFGRYAQLLPAILIYILYANLLMVGRSWIENGSVSIHLGLWWIHGLLLVLIVLIWLTQLGWLYQWKMQIKSWWSKK